MVTFGAQAYPFSLYTWALKKLWKLNINCINLLQRIQYAKSKSDCVAKAEGSYVPREKKKKQEEKGTVKSFYIHDLFYDSILSNLLDPCTWATKTIFVVL